jgi:hypothetical protein
VFNNKSSILDDIQKQMDEILIIRSLSQSLGLDIIGCAIGSGLGPTWSSLHVHSSAFVREKLYDLFSTESELFTILRSIYILITW